MSNQSEQHKIIYNSVRQPLARAAVFLFRCLVKCFEYCQISEEIKIREGLVMSAEKNLFGGELQLGSEELGEYLMGEDGGNIYYEN